MTRQTTLLILFTLTALSGCRALREQLNAAELSSAEGAESVTQSVANLEALEETCVPGNPDSLPEMVEVQIFKFDEIAGALAVRFTENNLEVTPVDAKWNPRDVKWEDKNLKAWLTKMRGQQGASRCELLELAYAFAVWQAATIEPADYTLKWSPLKIQKPQESFEVDRRKLSWAMRYLNAASASDFPESCQALRTKGLKRWQAIWSDHKPLGYVEDKCSKPMSAFYASATTTLK